MINKCPICDCGVYRRITYREGIPLTTQTLYSNRDDARRCLRGSINMVICETCGFVFNTLYDPLLEIYDSQYNNSASASESFRRYMMSSIDYIIEKYDESPEKILEIGCGCDALYLEMVAKKVRCKNIIGYDPSFEGHDICSNVKIIKKYYDFNGAGGDYNNLDWLISRHTIEHLSQPKDLFKNVNALRRSNQKHIGFFETPDVNWTLSNHVFFDFGYEHCSLFSFSSFYKMAEIMDLRIDEIKSAFNNQYLWVFAQNMGYKDKEDFNRQLERTLGNGEKYSESEIRIKGYIEAFLDRRRKEGKIAIWGAGGKGNVFSYTFDSKCEIIDYLIDKNENKHGRYIPLSGHEIVSPRIMSASDDGGIKTLIIMNEAYKDEIKREVKHLDILIVTADELCRRAIEGQKINE